MRQDEAARWRSYLQAAEKEAGDRDLSFAMRAIAAFRDAVAEEAGNAPAGKSATAGSVDYRKFFYTMD